MAVAKKNQLRFGFLDDIDREIEEQRKYEDRIFSLEVYQGWYDSACRDLPPNKIEQKYVDMGIRMSRHVHHLECLECDYDTYSHCPPDFPEMWDPHYKTYYPMKVCIRDWFGKCVEWGIVPDNYEGCPDNMQERIRASIERLRQRRK
jgi:hypothetical protein